MNSARIKVYLECVHLDVIYGNDPGVAGREYCPCRTATMLIALEDYGLLLFYGFMRCYRSSRPTIYVHHRLARARANSAEMKYLAGNDLLVNVRTGEQPTEPSSLPDVYKLLSIKGSRNASDYCC